MVEKDLIRQITQDMLNCYNEDFSQLIEPDKLICLIHKLKEIVFESNNNVVATQENIIWI